MRKMKKIIASVLSASFALSLCNFSKVDAYHEGQKHTWRVYEKVSAASCIGGYRSELENVYNYEYVLQKRQSSSSNLVYISGYDHESKTLIHNVATNDEKKPITTNDGYLTVSAWRTPTEIKNFNMNYETSIYKTDGSKPNNGEKIILVPIMIGDVNQDKYVNKSDSEMISKYLAGSIKLTDKQILAADINNSGNVDFLDLVNIEKFVSGNIKFFKQADEK